MTLALYLAPTPDAYVVVAPQGRGLVVSADGVGEVEMSITGIAKDVNKAVCGTPAFIGVLDEYAAMFDSSTLREYDLETTYIKQGEFITEDIFTRKGFDPLRTMLISGVVGRDIPGGKTIYGVDVVTDCQDAIFVGVASKQRPKEDFLFKRWKRVMYPNFIARPVVRGKEFRIFLYTKGAGRFKVHSITVWMKLTDRRGFNTSPQAVKQESSQ